MRCIKTGCTLNFGEYNYHGDLFVTGVNAPEFYLKGSPKDSRFLADGSEDGAASLNLIDNALYDEYGHDCYEVFMFTPGEKLLSFFSKWEPALYLYFTQGEV